MNKSSISDEHRVQERIIIVILIVLILPFIQFNMGSAEPGYAKSHVCPQFLGVWIPVMRKIADSYFATSQMYMTGPPK